MSNIRYLSVYCRRNHPRRKMIFIGFDSLGAIYRCPWCKTIRHYKNFLGRVVRTS